MQFFSTRSLKLPQSTEKSTASGQSSLDCPLTYSTATNLGCTCLGLPSACRDCSPHECPTLQEKRALRVAHEARGSRGHLGCTKTRAAHSCCLQGQLQCKHALPDKCVTAEFIVGGWILTMACIYIYSSSSYSTTGIIERLRVIAKGRFIICGDINAHHPG